MTPPLYSDTAAPLLLLTMKKKETIVVSVFTVSHQNPVGAAGLFFIFGISCASMVCFHLSQKPDSL